MEITANFITAFATIGLLIATGALVWFTKRLTDVSSAPQVIAVLQPSRWSIMHTDLIVENTGNATAFDVRITFDPPLLAEKTGRQDPMLAPFDKVTVLKPGQTLASFIGKTHEYLKTSYEVTISWTKAPGKENSRESIVYHHSLKHLERATKLGPSDPAAATAEELKKIREAVIPFFRGNKRARIDVYSQADRDDQNEKMAAAFEEMRSNKTPDDASE